MESLFVLWRTTGDEKWRERGYEIFLAIEKAAKMEIGYASVARVDAEMPYHMDDMPRCVLFAFKKKSHSDAYTATSSRRH